MVELVVVVVAEVRGEVSNTLEPHYNAHCGVHSDISVITEQPYNEGLLYRKYKQWEPCLLGVISK